MRSLFTGAMLGESPPGAPLGVSDAPCAHCGPGAPDDHWRASLLLVLVVGLAHHAQVDVQAQRGTVGVDVENPTTAK